MADPLSEYGGQPHTIASQHYQSHSCVPVVCTGFAQGLYKAPKIKTAEPFLSDCGLHRASRQIKTASKGIIRKECQSFTNHGHDKTPPTVFNPLSLWLTLPLNMGVSHTLWPPSITRAILARLWFAQGLYKVCTRFVQGTKKQNNRAILARLWFAQGLHRVCPRHKKTKQQIHTCAPVVRTGFVQGTKKQNSRSIHTAASFICKAYMHMALKKCHLPVSPLQKYLRGTCFFKNDFFKWTYDY